MEQIVGGFIFFCKINNLPGITQITFGVVALQRAIQWQM